MSRVLVTGGAGFVGSHVADALIRRGHDVAVLDDLSGGCGEHVPAGARLLPGDVADATRVDASCAASRAGIPFEGLEIERHLPESWRRE